MISGRSAPTGADRPGGDGGTGRPEAGPPPRRWQNRSYWMGLHPYQAAPPLAGDTACDIVIVGGGYTGLWTAIQLKETDPSVDVVVLDAHVAGYGASGRNGGFAMTMVGRGLYDLERKVGRDNARATHFAMRQSLREMQAFCLKEGIDASVTAPGLLTISNGPEQDIRIRQDLEAAARLDLDDFQELSSEQCHDLVHTRRARIGHFEADSLLVDPAALTRGLRDAALRRGVRIYEQTPVWWLDEASGHGVEAITPTGRVGAERAVVATNAYAQALFELRRYIFTVYAHVIVTEALTDAQWERVGWQRGMGIEDKRVMPHFHRPTPDESHPVGGRDAPFVHRGPDARVDGRPWIFGRLEETFRWTFPSSPMSASPQAGPVQSAGPSTASPPWAG